MADRDAPDDPRQVAHALKPAADPDFLAELDDLERRAAAGDIGPTITAEEFRRRYRL
jgi:hypothetical protein